MECLGSSSLTTWVGSSAPRFAPLISVYIAASLSIQMRVSLYAVDECNDRRAASSAKIGSVRCANKEMNFPPNLQSPSVITKPNLAGTLTVS